MNVSSGGASSWVRQQDEATKKFYSDPDISKEALVADVAKQAAGSEGGWPGTYGLSKAGLTAYTLYQAKAYPHLTCVCAAQCLSRRWRKCRQNLRRAQVSFSRLYSNMNMTKGFGAKLTPEQGCVSSLHALFGDVTSGWYYGSDAKRSPLTCCRDPGTPEYEGEENPDRGADAPPTNWQSFSCLCFQPLAPRQHVEHLDRIVARWTTVVGRGRRAATTRECGPRSAGQLRERRRSRSSRAARTPPLVEPRGRGRRRAGAVGLVAISAPVRSNTTTRPPRCSQRP